MPGTAACRLCGGTIATGRGGRAVYCDPCRTRINKEASSRRAACVECGAAFLAPSRSVRYCSDACREKGYGRRGQRAPRQRPLPPHDGTGACRVCGKKFRAPTRIVKYCSDECRRQGYMRGRRSSARPRAPERAECRSCGKEFAVEGRAGTPRVYCSPGCRADGRRAKTREYMRRYLADPEKRAAHIVRGTEAAAAKRRAATTGGA